MPDPILRGPKPYAIPKPATADSLAGVIARLFPTMVDSAAVDGIQWQKVDRDRVGTAPLMVYNYRFDKPVRDRFITVPTVAETRKKDGVPSILFSRDMDGNPEIVKHEMLHAMLPKAWTHGPKTDSLFSRLDGYRGR